MPYVVKKSGSGYKVFKKGSSKSFSKKGLSKEKAEAQQKALYANESLDSTKVGSNLEFKGVYPAFEHNEASVVYKVKSEKGTNLTIVYSIGQSSENTDYQYFIIRDLNDPKGRPHKFEDPSAEEAQKTLAVYNLTSDDVEMAGQDGYEKIADHLSKEKTTENSFEEKLEFFDLFKTVISE